jgi:hypothetical protein
VHDRRVTLGVALFVCLLVATLVASVLVVRARTPDLVLEVTEPARDSNPRLAVDGPGPNEITIAFFVRESDAHAVVGIVDSHEDLVRTLDSDVALEERQPVTYVWDGRTDDGGPAPPGRYRLLVELPSQDREMIWPKRITVEPSGPDSE